MRMENPRRGKGVRCTADIAPVQSVKRRSRGARKAGQRRCLGEPGYRL